ncbi:MAG: Asp-tRNA(Asn)/Glu-tRNA(Gln) amidotransferase subunit GatA, partial [Parcubacteria group bacterium SW_4_46_8]
MNTEDLTLTKIKDGIEAGDVSAEEVTEIYKEKIDTHDEDINAFLEVFEQDDAGIPLAIKDNILIDGREVTAGSKILEGYTATYDATAISWLKNTGFSFVGRTNMDEFAMGSSTENSAYQTTINPHGEGRVPGGSSGGSAAAVASGMAPAALGSDTGGSVRQPASMCGVVGLKPTYGAVSRSGLIAMGSSLDQIGPITNTVEDAQLLFNIMAGEDPMDATTIPDTKREEHNTDNADPSENTVGVPMELIDSDGIDERVKENFQDNIETLKSCGYTVVDIQMPNLKYALAVYYVLMPAEVSSNLARFDGVKYGAHVDGEDLLDDYFQTRKEKLGKEVRRRIILGTYVLSAGYYDAYYNRAVAARDVITTEFNEAFREVDIIAAPTSPSP